MNIIQSINQYILRHFNLKLQNLKKAYLPWPTCFSAVDIAIVDVERDLILLGLKGDRWCIPGGFTDPSSNFDEEDAVRELFEETRIVADPSEMIYIGNTKIPDERYENSPNGIRTHFFFFNADSTKIKIDYIVTKDERPLDDLDEIAWFSLKERFDLVDKGDTHLQKPHRILIHKLKKFMEGKNAR